MDELRAREKADDAEFEQETKLVSHRHYPQSIIACGVAEFDD